jgi:two-component system cell cycle sensor histidine kinase/response regulator CckA
VGPSGGCMDPPAPRSDSERPPPPTQREGYRIATTLRAVSITFLIVMALLFGASFLIFPHRPQPVGVDLLFGVLAWILLALWLLQRGHLRLAAHMLVWMTWCASTAGMIGAGGIDTPGFSFYVVTIVAAGLLLGGRMAIVMGLASAVGGGLVGLAQVRGWLPEPVFLYEGVATLWWIEMTLFGAAGSLVYISMNRIRDALGDAERSERDLAERNLELSQILAEKRRAEEGEALLHLAMSQAREAIVVVDVGRKVRFVNAAFEALTGLSADAIEGGDVREFFGGLEQEMGSEVLATLAAGQPWHGRITLSQPTERLVDASFAGVVDEQGQTTHFVALARDVTREAALEADLRQSQKLEALGQLAGGVAHDFNNLLAVIQGYAEIVGDAQDDPDLREAASQIDEAARHAAALTSQLRAFGRRQVSHPRVVDLNAVMREADGMLRALVPENIEIEMRLEPTLRPVRLDPRQVHQILLNLAANARDAMIEGGRLEIRTEAAADGGVAVTVADTGEGMDESIRERIFEPFFTTKRPGEGTGLGLASVYGIVEQCGGMIEVESHPGRGSRFRITFPSTEEPLEGAEGASAAGARARGAAVLVAEDQDNVRRLLGRQLGHAGFQVTLAEDGEAALERLTESQRRIDLLVTDVTMPRLGGSALADGLRVRWPDLRVLYISGYWPDELVAKIEALLAVGSL